MRSVLTWFAFVLILVCSGGARIFAGGRVVAESRGLRFCRRDFTRSNVHRRDSCAASCNAWQFSR